MNHTCPSCHRALYDRRFKTCGYCGAPIPESRRYTPEQTAELEKTLAELETQRQQQEERDAQRASHIIIFPDSSLG